MRQRRSEPEHLVARRFDAVDEQGRRRASFGLLGSYGEEGDVVGVDLFDDVGSSVLSVVLEQSGAAAISFALGGNEVLVLGSAGEEASSRGAGPFVTMCRPDGEVVARLHVGSEGRVHLVSSRVECSEPA